MKSIQNPSGRANRVATFPTAVLAALLQLACVARIHAGNYTISNQQGSGGSWDSTSVWNPGGQSATAIVAGDPAATFETLIGSRLRSPSGAALASFPGGKLTVDGNGVFVDPNLNGAAFAAGLSEIRFKQGGSSDAAAGTTGNPGYGTITFPNLVMNGGLLDLGNAGTVVLTNGVITVTNGFVTNSMSYFYNDGFLDRGYVIYSQLAGGASLGTHMYAQFTNVYQPNYNHSCRIAGVNNTFTGKWEIMGGVLVGATTNAATGVGCLGTNTITVDAAGVLETLYDIDNPNANLLLNGQVYLTQDDTFRSVIVNGVPLAAGTYSAGRSERTFSTNFPATWTAVVDPVALASDPNTISGSITVLANNTTPLAITSPAANARVLLNQTATFTVGISGPFTSAQWYSNNVAVPGANGLSYTTPPVTVGANYTLIVANNINSATNSATVTIGNLVSAPGFLNDLVWFTTTGTIYDRDTVQTTTDTPGLTAFVPALDVGSYGVNYGEQINGYFIPAVSGNYVFFLDSDDASYLFLSPDTNAANKQLIAQQDGAIPARQWTAGGTQSRSDEFSPDGVTMPFSGGIPLVGGRPYYIEADHTQAGGGADLCVTFKLIAAADPANGSPSLLNGNLISTFAIDGGTLTITNAPQNTSVVELHSATFTVGVRATGSPAALMAVAYQWRLAGVPISGATDSAYTTPPLALADSGARFDVVILMPGAVAITSTPPATVTVTPDPTRPVISETPGAVLDANGNFEVGLVFSKPISVTSATNLGNYNLSGGSIIGAQFFSRTGLDANCPAVVLTTAGLTPGNNYSLSVSGIVDLTSAANAIATTNISFQTTAFNWAAIGISDFYLDGNGAPTTNAVLPWEAVAVGTTGFDLINAGQSFGIFDSMPTEDDLTFAYLPVTNNFDVIVQIPYTDPAIADPTFGYSQVGLMMREYIDPPGPTSARFQSVAVTPAADYLGSPGVASHILSVGRLTAGANAVDPNTTGPSAPIVNLIPAPYPNVWLRLKRTLTATNDLINLYHSVDGTNWLASGDQDMVSNNDPTTDIPANVYVGIFYAATVGQTPIGSLQSWTSRARNFSFLAPPAPLAVTITSPTFAAGHFSLSFNTQPNITYIVQYTATLSSANWQTLATQPGTGGTVSVTDPGSAGARFYRVVAQ